MLYLDPSFRRPARGPSLATLLCLGLATFALACASDTQDGARSDAAGVSDVAGMTDVATTDASVDVPEEDTRADATQPADEGDGPDCETDEDCLGHFTDLTQCEQTTCEDGVCKRAFVAEETPCDDGDPCTAGDRCAKDPSGVFDCLPAVEGCDDGDVCNGIEHCEEDGCTTGEPLECGDGDKCDGEETCDPVEGCKDGQPLTCPSDGDPCNGEELCEAAVGCTSGAPPTCDDGSDCTKDTCVPNEGCSFQADPTVEGCCETDAHCQDDNPCTKGTCNEKGACVIDNVEGSCPVNQPCATGGTCKDGACMAELDDDCTALCTLKGAAGDTVDCPLGLAALGDTPHAVDLKLQLGYAQGTAKLTTLVDVVCIAEFCTEVSIPQSGSTMESTGHTVFLSPPAPDAWQGQVGVEVANVLAADTAITSAWFDGDQLQGDASLFILRFQLTAATGGTDVVIHSLSANAAGEAPLASKLVEDIIVTTDAPCGDDICFDGKPCTQDLCDAETCKNPFGDGVCDDLNPCTVGDACDAEGECIPTGLAPAGTACAGEDKCLDVGTCSKEGVCEMTGEPKECDPPGPCTTAECNPLTGECLFGADLDAVCNDDDECTKDDVCTAMGTCAGTTITCNDLVGCTTDTCDKAEGCVYTPQDAACDDTNPCTSDACTATGCTHDPIAASCTDNDPCTLNDTCEGGQCTGDPDPKCGCDSTAMCAPLDDGNPCNGTLACIGGQCVVDPATIVSCPADGYECKEGWACNTSSGACEGTAMVCDDGIACTDDKCEIGKGCIHEPTPACPVGYICKLWGNKGELQDCALRLARKNQSDPMPTAGEVKLHYDTKKMKLTNFVDKFCIGMMCGDILFVSCNDGESDCKVGQNLKPTGHTLDVLPTDMDEWKGLVQAATFHMTDPSTALTEAYVNGTATAGGDPEYLLARFELLQDIAEADAVKIEVSTPSFPPLSGLPMKVTIEVLDGERTFVATPE